jgi:2-amino-4-hydroxy-6-hydroxymethyldihydropteridine diphosphokinase
VARVVALLDAWAAALALPPGERAQWRRAGWLHDAFRDADEALLRTWTGPGDEPRALLHGPAAAARAAEEGEADTAVLGAVRWHTTGAPDWGRVGHALYAADFLEPGREFAREERAALAREFPVRPQAVLLAVVELKLAHHRRKGRPDHPLTMAFLAELTR